jgi:hypothetical protein
VRVLFDEGVPRGLRRDLPGHQVTTVQALGWAGTKNGELLRRAAVAGFGVLVTTDQRMEYQQNILAAGLGVVVLRARSTDIEELRPLIPAVLAAHPTIRPGVVVHVP